MATVSTTNVVDRFIGIMSLALAGALLSLPIESSAAPIIFSASGADAAAIQNTVDAFRAGLGANNGNVAGSQPTGHREINWDGGGAAANATIFPSPMTTFNSGATTRGLVSTTPGAGLEISGQPAPEFGDINSSYPAIFQTFSAPRLFTAVGSNIIDVLFFEPGTNTPAAVTAFGAVFTDVDLANTTSLQLFSPAGISLGTFFAPTFNNGLSFLGLVSPDVIGRVRIVAGNTALGPNANDGGAVDVVALDDFIYGEPRAVDAVPEPVSLSLLGIGLGTLMLRRRGRRSGSR
jgi:hypothetical protein